MYYFIFRYSRVTAENRVEYVQLAKAFRLHEFDPAASAVREGMSRVVPVPLLSLFTGFELETMVCGSPDIPLHLLKSVATYKGVEANSPLVIWFWEVMEEFGNAERSLFLRFVWGRTRLPRSIADFRGRDFVLQVKFQVFCSDYFFHFGLDLSRFVLAEIVLIDVNLFHLVQIGLPLSNMV